MSSNNERILIHIIIIIQVVFCNYPPNSVAARAETGSRVQALVLFCINI